MSKNSFPNFRLQVAENKMKEAEAIDSNNSSFDLRVYQISLFEAAARQFRLAGYPEKAAHATTRATEITKLCVE